MELAICFDLALSSTGRDPSESFGHFEPIRCRMLGIVVPEPRARVFRVQLQRVG